MNKLLKNILRSFANISADDTNADTTKNEMERCLAADLSSDISLTAQVDKNCSVTFDTSNTKSISFHNPHLTLVTLNGCSISEMS